MDWPERITLDPGVCHGQACIKGTRILVAVVLDNLAAGLPADKIIRSYPSLTPEDIQAAIAYAAQLARGQVIPLPRGTRHPFEACAGAVLADGCATVQETELLRGILAILGCPMPPLTDLPA